MKRAVVTVAADHGAGDGDAATALSRAGAAESPLSVAARAAGIAIVLVDAGVRGEVTDASVIALGHGSGTADIRHAPAMSAAAAEQGVAAGMALACALAEQGIDTLALGQIGDGATIAARATLVGLGAIEPADDEHWRPVREAIARAGKPADLLAELGGFDIAVLAGLIAGAGDATIILDDVATWAAAMLVTQTRNVHLGHQGSCPVCRAAVTRRFGEPILSAGVGSGDGTGAALALARLPSPG